MFENIHKLRQNSNAFLANIKVYEAIAIEESEKELVDLNQKQLQSSKTTSDKAIRPLYSVAYAKKKGYKEPDGYLTGQMYNEMFVDANENDGSFSITSFAPHTASFANRYGDVFGISPSSEPKGRKAVMDRLRNRYYKLIFK